MTRQQVGNAPGPVDHIELLESGPDRVPHPIRRRLSAGLSVVIVLVGAAGWYLDSGRQTSEFAALLTCVARAETAWSVADARVTGMSSYVRPTIGVGTSRDMQRALHRLVAEQAEIGGADVRRALDRCRDVSVLPFHASLRAAQAAYVACLRAQLDRLETIVADGSTAFRGPTGIIALRSEARVGLAAAAPDESGRQDALNAIDPSRPRANPR